MWYLITSIEEGRKGKSLRMAQVLRKSVAALQVMSKKKGSAKREVCIVLGLPMKTVAKYPFFGEESPKDDG